MFSLIKYRIRFSFIEYWTFQKNKHHKTSCLEQYFAKNIKKLISTDFLISICIGWSDELLNFCLGHLSGTSHVFEAIIDEIFDFFWLKGATVIDVIIVKDVIDGLFDVQSSWLRIGWAHIFNLIK